MDRNKHNRGHQNKDDRDRGRQAGNSGRDERSSRNGRSNRGRRDRQNPGERVSTLVKLGIVGAIVVLLAVLVKENSSFFTGSGEHRFRLLPDSGLWDTGERAAGTSSSDAAGDGASDAAAGTTAGAAAAEEITEHPYYGTFELPVNGTSGYASVSMSLCDASGAAVSTLEAGQAFTILEQEDDRFRVALGDGREGYVATCYTLVNLPDLVPSAVYYDSNSDSSLFRSSGYDLPGITGEQLYNVRFYNARLGREEYVMPVLYGMAVKVREAQREAMSNGDCLFLYETFRPYEVQKEVGTALTQLAASNAEVNAGINTAPWNQGWFIAMSLSNHQRGCAMDVSLVRAGDTQTVPCGDYTYTRVTEYGMYDMPTQMHELSRAAAAFDPPVSSKDDTAWRSASLSPLMNSAAVKLQTYCTDSGLSPLSSEWWHFNDLEARAASQNQPSNGRYYLTECVSRVPE